MKRVLTAFLFALMAIIPAFAQNKPVDKPAPPAAALPTVDQIIEKSIQATGGKAAHEKLNSRVAKGQFEIPSMGVGGPFESYAKAPNKVKTIITIEGFGVVEQGFDGAVGYSSDPQSGLREMQGEELASTKRDADFYANLKVKEYFPKMTVRGKDKVGEREVYVLDAVTAEGTPEVFYFDTQSGLLVRNDSQRSTPQGKMLVKVYMDDYKEVDGVKMPFTIRQDTEAMNFVIKFTEIKHNVPVEDAKLKKPAN
jgi:zinc protease